MLRVERWPSGEIGCWRCRVCRTSVNAHNFNCYFYISIILFFLYLCLEGEAAVQLKDILIFATGLDKIPAMGFSPQPELHFLHPDEQPSRFPKANTCSLTLSIPVGLCFDNFKHNMNLGIGASEQFGEA